MTVKELRDALNEYMEIDPSYADEEVIYEDARGGPLEIVGIVEDSYDEDEEGFTTDCCRLTSDLYDIPCPEDEVME